MGKYFGTDGFRGEANKNLTFEHAVKIGRFLGWYYGANMDKKAKVVIGKDTRRSSYMFEYALCTGLMASGADAYIMHVTTTPSVAYITRIDDFDCGIMISASHNPYYDNGIKLLNSKGEKMEEETLLKVEDYIDGKIEIPFAERDAIGRTVDYVAGRNRYIGYLISMSKYSFKGVKVGLDVANGASWMALTSIPTAVPLTLSTCKSLSLKKVWISALPMTETLTAALLLTKRATSSPVTTLSTSTAYI